jgi:hypothetical protein
MIKGSSLTFSEAESKLAEEDRKSEKWTKHFFDKDDNDPRLYDICLNLDNIGPAVAASIIVGAARGITNGDATIMRKMLSDTALAAEIEARMLDVFPEVQALVTSGRVIVQVKGSLLQEKQIVEKAQDILKEIRGIDSVRISVAPSMYVPF